MTQPTISKERAAEIKRKFPHFPECTDTTAKRREYILRLPKFAEDFLIEHVVHDSRDIEMISVILNICGTLYPSLIMLWLFPSHKLGIFCTVFNFFMWMQRFILLLHYSEHRKLFKDTFGFMNSFLSMCLAPFFGIPCNMYRAHHVVMHHIENNVFDEDLSSTEPYQRDSILDWFVYYLKHNLAVVTLPLYAVRKKRFRLAAGVLAGAAVWLGAMCLLGRVNFHFMLYALLVPYIISNLAMMLGNWGQHIFVDPAIASMPQKLKSVQFNCALTYQCMNHFENQLTFNDGFHVTHHVNSRCHWLDMPVNFLENLEEYAKHGVIVFNNLGFFDVAMACFTKNHRTLYDKYDAYVHLGTEKMSFEDFQSMITKKLKPIRRTNRMEAARLYAAEKAAQKAREGKD